jgi:dihydrofolate reductase
MGKVMWHTLKSLDGFIAGPGDDMRWAFQVDAGPDETIDGVVTSIGALLVGRRTQDVEDREQPGFYGGSYRGPFFVLRHDPPAQPPVVKDVTGRFVDLPIGGAVALAQHAAGDMDVVVLGANVAQQCLGAGLLDEVLIHLAPVLLGDGVRLFDRPGGDMVRLRKISVHETGQLTALRFAVSNYA